MENTLQIIAAKALATLIVALLVAFFGLRTYFRQKEYEIVKQRYLEQSLDILCGDLEAVASAFSHNWARCLQIVKAYRDIPTTLDVSETSRGFVSLDSTCFNRVAHHRLQLLVGSDVFWSVYQLALSRHTSLNSVVTEEIPNAIRAQLMDTSLANHKELVEAATDELEPMMKKSDNFAPLSQALYQVSAILERERLNFRKVRRFAKRKDVMRVIADLGSYYAKDIGCDAP